MKAPDKPAGRRLKVFLFTMLLLSGYQGSGNAESGAVRLGLPLQSTSSLFILATEKGYFAKEGLQITVKDYPSGARALNDGLLSGAADVVASAEVPLVFAGFTHDDLSVIASIGTISNFAKMVAIKQSGIKKASDLRGKRIGTQKGSGIHFFLHLFLARYRMTERDVKIKYMKIEEMPVALSKGEIDAYSGREPFISQARSKLGPERVLVFEEPGLYNPIDILIAKKAFIGANPKAVESILKALIRAEDFMNKQPEEAKRIIGQRLRISAGEIADTWNNMLFKVDLPQSLLLALEDEARWVSKNGLTTAKSPPNYLDFIHIDSLKAVRPRSVGIIR